MIAQTPKPPYYAVIFSSVKKDDDLGYAYMAEKMMQLASQQEGFLGVESVRNNLGITISYWDNLDAIKNWKLNSEHLVAQGKGRKDWYKIYKVRIALVERDYGFGNL